MTIKHHIAISATISLALIALIACQQKTEAPKEQSKVVPEQKTKVEEVMKNFEQEAKAETEKLETKVEQAAKEIKEQANEAAAKVEEKSNEAESNVNEGIKEIETKVDETVKKVESEIETIENKIEDTTEFEEDKGPKNLFVNGDFNDGFSEWSHDKDVSIVEVDGKKCVECIAPADIKEQTRIWQTINTTSGHVYKLSFKVKAEKKGAFAIFRDHQNNKEQYLFADASEEWKEYQENFKSNKDGEYKVFLSCQGKGKYYFSDASIIDASLEQE